MFRPKIPPPIGRNLPLFTRLPRLVGNSRSPPAGITARFKRRYAAGNRGVTMLAGLQGTSDRPKVVVQKKPDSDLKIPMPV